MMILYVYTVCTLVQTNFLPCSLCTKYTRKGKMLVLLYIANKTLRFTKIFL